LLLLISYRGLVTSNRVAGWPLLLISYRGGLVVVVVD